MNFFKLKSKAAKADQPASPSGKLTGHTVRSVLPFGNRKKQNKPQHVDSFGRNLDLSRTPSTVSTDSHSSSGSSWSCHGNQHEDSWDLEPNVIYPVSSAAPSNTPSVYPQSSAASSMYHLPSASSAAQSRERLDRPETSQSSSSSFHRPNGSQSSFYPSNKSQSSFHHPHPFLPASGQVQQTDFTINRSNLHASLPSDVAEYNPFGCRPYPVPAALHLSIDSLPPPSMATNTDDVDGENDGNSHRISLDQSQLGHLSFPVHPASSRARAGPPSLPTTANRSRANSTASNRTTASSIHSHSTGSGADSTFYGSSTFLAGGLATRTRSASIASATHGTYQPPHPSPLGHPTGRVTDPQNDSDEGEETLRPSACCPAHPARSGDISSFPFPSAPVREIEKENETELAHVWKNFMKDVTLPIKPSTAVAEFIHKPNRPPPPPPSSSAPSSALPPVPSAPTVTPQEGLRVRLPAEDAESEPFGLAYLIDDANDQDEDDDLTVNLSHLVPPLEASLQSSHHVPSLLSPSQSSRLITHRDRQSTLSTQSFASFASSVSSARSSEPATPSFPIATTAPLFYHLDGSYLRVNVDQTELEATHSAHIATDALQTEFWRTSKTMVRAPTWWSGPPPSADATPVRSDSDSEPETTKRPMIDLGTASPVQSTVAWGEAL
ncbi:hypothetical protein [Phaffia rhodozyma]|uniref:Uncharacterized protein n=1 Tax=Phaffia rhodozyma TaxID=264483 RepID=A0A0F7SK07_PHARH|nr:hypothetical protein [Phaffia rhodozyma]